MKKQTIFLASVIFLITALFSACDRNYSFMLYFETNGGNEIPAVSVNYGDSEADIIPNDPVREGYIFGGWYLDNDTWKKPFTEYRSLGKIINITVYAKWVAATAYTLKEFKIITTLGEQTLNFDDMSQTDREAYGLTEAVYGVTVNITDSALYFTGNLLSLNNPYTYTLSGTNLLINGEILSQTFNEISLENGVLSLGRSESGVSYSFIYKSAGAHSETYEVTFETNGGNAVEKQVIASGAPAVKPSDPEKDDATFIDWYKDAALTVPWDFTTDKIEGATTIYAKWLEKSVLYISSQNGAVTDEWLTAAAQRFEEKYASVSLETGKTGVKIHITDSGDINNSLIETADGDMFITQTAANISSEYLADLTDIVNEALEGEEKSIYDKLGAFAEDIRAADGEYYSLPNYTAYGGIVYDIDLFEKYNLSLPATYQEFFTLCGIMLEYNITPFIWSGEYGDCFTQMLLNALLSDYSGEEEMSLNYSLNGTANTLSHIENGTLVFDSPDEITGDKGYKLYSQAGRYYALKFLESIISGGCASPYSYNVAVNHIDAQTKFLESELINSPIAMLIDGSWWEKEADGIFQTLEELYGSAASKEERHFGYMALPRVNAQCSGQKTLLNISRSSLFIKKNAENEGIAKLFLKFIYSEESLSEFTQITGMKRAAEYTVSQDIYDGLTSFEKQIWNYSSNCDTVGGYDTVQLIKDNPVYFNKNWYAYINGEIYSSPIDAMKNHGITAEQYFTGIIAYHSQTNWKTELDLWND